MRCDEKRRAGGAAGFTLVELMVAMVLTLLAAGGMYKIYVNYSASYDAQYLLAEMHQNLRIGVTRLEEDIRMAGYDPLQTEVFGITGAGGTSLTFTMDIQNEDGSVGADETITYEYDAVNRTLDRKIDGGAGQPVVNEVDALDFHYLDGDGAVLDPAVDDLGTVRSVQIAMVVRTAAEIYSYTDTRSYINLQGSQILAPQDDHFHRRLLASQVKCRNMGL